MLSIAVIIFREALEIFMIVGIILAATRGLKGRGLWVSAGFGLGILGASVVAYFTEYISEAMQGMGQELFNAIILIFAAFFIGWTLLWMQKHAQVMTAHLKKVGQDISEGVVPLSTLMVVVGLSVLREGSEIVLFIYGMALSGQGLSTLIVGGLVGLACGAGLGGLLYFGLLKVSTRYVFKVTGWMLMLLVSGMMAQAAAFLTQAGLFEGLSQPMWDSSSLISDEGVLGKTLHGLVGYSAQPSFIQGIFYFLTLILLMTAVSLLGSVTKNNVSGACKTEG